MIIVSYPQHQSTVLAATYYFQVLLLLDAMLNVPCKYNDNIKPASLNLSNRDLATLYTTHAVRGMPEYVMIEL